MPILFLIRRSISLSPLIRVRGAAPFSIAASFAQNGITTVKEVIQVKRNITSNVTRPILDALRGSLHRFDAIPVTSTPLSFVGVVTVTSSYPIATRRSFIIFSNPQM